MEFYEYFLDFCVNYCIYYRVLILLRLILICDMKLSNYRMLVDVMVDLIKFYS